MGLTLFLFLGAVSCAAVSALFCFFAFLAGDTRLARVTAAAVVACGGMAVYLGTLL